MPSAPSITFSGIHWFILHKDVLAARSAFHDALYCKRFAIPPTQVLRCWCGRLKKIQIDPKWAQDGYRMEPKFSQNRKDNVQRPNLTTRWPPRPLYSEGLIDFEQFLGPLRGPKIDPKCDLGGKSGHQSRFFPNCSAFLFFSVFCA